MSKVKSKKPVAKKAVPSKSTIDTVIDEKEVVATKPATTPKVEKKVSLVKPTTPAPIKKTVPPKKSSVSEKKQPPTVSEVASLFSSSQTSKSAEPAKKADPSSEKISLSTVASSLQRLSHSPRLNQPIFKTR